MSKFKLDYEVIHKKSAKEFKTKDYLLLGAGPTNLSLRVRNALSWQSINPISSEMYEIVDEVKDMLKYLFQTKNSLTLMIQASGNGGNEAILRNLVDSGEKIVIAIGGTWGEKVLDMAQRYKVDVLALRKPPGEIYTHQELEEAIVKHNAKLLFVTQGESSGGIVQRLDGLGKICHKLFDTYHTTGKKDAAEKTYTL